MKKTLKASPFIVTSLTWTIKSGISTCRWYLNGLRNGRKNWIRFIKKRNLKSQAHSNNRMGLANYIYLQLLNYVSILKNSNNFSTICFATFFTGMLQWV